MMNYYAIILICAGVLIRAAAVISNESFSLVPKIPAEICCTGVYRLVRHPSYTGTILIVFGMCFWASGLAVAAVISYLFYTILADRARLEEEMILTEFPAYAEYQNEVGFFTPKIYSNE